MRSRGAILLMIGLAGLGLGLVVADWYCEVVPGTIVEKRETVEELIDPFWRPVREIVVTFQPVDDAVIRAPWNTGRPDLAEVAALETDLTTYDSLYPGNIVEVRYFPPLPVAARLEQQSLATAIFRPLIAEFRESGILILVALLAWIILSLKFGWWPGFFVTSPGKLGLLALHLLILQALPLSLLGLGDLLPPPAGPRLHATATVQEIREITVVGGTRSGTTRSSPQIELPTPFQRVLLRYVPAGHDQPVVAVDEVTLGSVPGLVTENQLAITYPESQPRVAWLDSASRDHQLTNRLFIHGLFTVPVLVLVVAGQLFMLLVRLARTRQRRA